MRSVDEILRANKVRPRIVCADGASVSIQGNESAYCIPRDGDGPYTHIEAGFPDVQPPASWMEHAEEQNKPLETVYAYMPVACVQEFINAHGGIVSGELPPLCYIGGHTPMAEKVDGMKILRMFKMPFATNHFNANQKVWVVFLSGDEAAEVRGRYRGKGRYVQAWVKWSSKEKARPVIKVIEVTESFYSKIMKD